MGSSNLTDDGLGAEPESNYEYNLSLCEYEDVKFAAEEFARLWAESERIKKHSYLRDDFTPFGLYIKMLIEYFGKRVDYDPYNTDLLLPPKYIRLKYQSDAANQGYVIMMKHKHAPTGLKRMALWGVLDMIKKVTFASKGLP